MTLKRFGKSIFPNKNGVTASVDSVIRGRAPMKSAMLMFGGRDMIFPKG